MKKLFIIAFILIVTTNVSLAQWAQLKNGLGFGVVTSIAVSGTNTFAGTAGGGIFVSTNNGVAWNSVNNGVSYTYLDTVKTLYFSGTVLYAGVNTKGILKSLDYGASWTEVNNGITNLNINTIRVSGTNIFAASDGGGVFKTTNEGASWTTEIIGLSNLNIRDLTVGNGKVFVTTPLGIFSSPMGTIYWMNTSNDIPAPARNLKSIATDGTNIVISTYSTPPYVYKSTNAGINWTNISGNFPISNMIYDVVIIGTTIYASSASGGAYVTPVTASTWNILPVISNAKCFNSPGSRIFSGTESGIYFSTNAGVNWIQSNNGINALNINALESDGTNVYAGAEMTGVFFSADLGNNWINKNNGELSLENFSVLKLLTNGLNVYAVTNGNGGLLRTTNGGNYWSKVLGNIPSHTVYSVGLKGTTVYAGTNKGVYKSTDGVTFYASNSGITSITVKCITSDTGAVYFGCTNGIYKSANNGSSWIAMLTGYDVNDIKSTQYGIYAATSIGVFVSRNSGITWTHVSQNVLSPVYALAPTNLKLFFSTSNGVYRLPYDSVTATQINTGLFNKEVRALSALGNYLYAGTYGAGIFRRPLSEITGTISSQESLPKSFMLYQNYPNPFNPVTVIRYQLSAAGNVTLKVYDIKGREISTLINERLQAGIYGVNYNAGNLPSGIYYYNLVINGELISSKKMLLIK